MLENPGLNPASGSSAPVLDWSGTLTRLDGDEDLFKMVLSLFVTDVPKEIEVLKQALNANDGALVALKSHSIKSASLNVGAQLLAQFAGEIEFAAKRGLLGEVDSMLPAFECAFAALQATIGESLQRSAPAA